MIIILGSILSGPEVVSDSVAVVLVGNILFISHYKLPNRHDTVSSQHNVFVRADTKAGCSNR